MIKEIPETGIKYVTNGIPALILFENVPETPPTVTLKGTTATGAAVFRSERFHKEKFTQLIESLVKKKKIEKK